MSWCKPIIRVGYDCFEFGIIIGMLFMLLIVCFYLLFKEVRKELRKTKPNSKGRK